MGTPKILIVEDEMLIAGHIKQIITQHGYECAGIAINHNNAIELLENGDVDMAILDVNISGEKSGIDVAETINQKFNIPFLYLTSYADRNTITSLKETYPAGYLSKPIIETTLTTTIDIIWTNRNRTQKKLYKFQLGNTHYNINLKELLYVKSDHVYVELIFKTKKLVLRTSLRNMLEILPEETFKQASRSTVVNLDLIKSIKGNTIEIFEEIIKISRTYKNNFSYFSEPK